MRFDRLCAAAIAAIVVIGLGLQIFVSTAENDGNVLLALWTILRFFTILTNSLLVGLMVLVATGRAPAAVWHGAVTFAIVVVGAVHHLLLAHLANQTGLSVITDFIFHTAAPVLGLLWWLVFAPKRPLPLSAPFLWLIWPLLYTTYALLRGAADGVYPYPFLDLGELGWGGLAVSVAQMLVGFLIASGLLWALGRLLGRVQGAQA